MTTEYERIRKAFAADCADGYDTDFVSFSSGWQAALSAPPARQDPRVTTEMWKNAALSALELAKLGQPAPQGVEHVMELVNRLDASAAFDGVHDHHPSVKTERLYEDVKSAVVALVSERDAAERLRKDAERYRWLREQDDSPRYFVVYGSNGLWGECGHREIYGDLLDAAIQESQP